MGVPAQNRPRIINDDPDLKKKNRPVEPDWAATIAGRLNAGLLDRANGSVHDNWIGGILPPIRSRKHDAVLDVVRQNERIIETKIGSLEQEARHSGQAWVGRVLAAAGDSGKHLLRDVAVYPGHVGRGGRRQSTGGETSGGKRQAGTALGQPQRTHQPHLHHGQGHENATHAAYQPIQDKPHVEQTTLETGHERMTTWQTPFQDSSKPSQNGLSQ